MSDARAGCRRSVDTWRRLTAVAALAAFWITTPSAQMSPAVLLRHADVGGFVPTSFRARLSMQHASGHSDQSPLRSEVELYRGGADRTLVRFLDATERGKYLLRLGPDLWFISPGAKAPVRLSPTHRIYGAATLDVLLGMHLADDYRIVSTSSQASTAGPSTVFELVAISAQQQFSSVRYVVRTATERPASALYRLRSGRESTLIEFFDWVGGTAGRAYAKRILVHDLLRKNDVTTIDAIEFSEQAVPAGLFDLHDPTARLALERSGR